MDESGTVGAEISAAEEAVIFAVGTSFGFSGLFMKSSVKEQALIKSKYNLKSGKRRF